MGASLVEQRAQSATIVPVFEVIDLTPVQTGNLLGFATVRVGKGRAAITIHKFRLIRHADQSLRICAPQEIWTDPSGRRRFSTLLTLPKDWQGPLSRCIIAIWKRREAEVSHESLLFLSTALGEHKKPKNYNHPDMPDMPESG